MNLQRHELNRTNSANVTRRHNTRPAPEKINWLTHGIGSVTNNDFISTGSCGDGLYSEKVCKATSHGSNKHQVAFNQAPKKRDPFAYYSCPDVRVAAIFQTKKKIEGKSDLSEMAGLQRPMRRNSLQKNTPTSSKLTAHQDDSSVSTRRSRVSVEMHDSVIHQHFEEILDDVDLYERIFEEDNQESEAIADGPSRKNKSTQSSSTNIIGCEFILQRAKAG